MKKAENTGNYIDISFSNKRKQCIFVTTLQKLLFKFGDFCVAPPVGAWIEIILNRPEYGVLESLPPWERGLKSVIIS